MIYIEGQRLPRRVQLIRRIIGFSVKKRLGEDQIKIFEATWRRDYPWLDTFFVESMACDAGLSRNTLLNRLPSLTWVVQLDYGIYATCIDSMQAYGKMLRETDGRHRDHTQWSTGVSGLSPLKKVG